MSGSRILLLAWQTGLLAANVVLAYINLAAGNRRLAAVAILFAILAVVLIVVTVTT